MAKSLLIVESPAKTKTISKFLGKDYIIKSSIGHIRDLPKASSENKKRTTASKTKTQTTKQTAEQKAISTKARFIKRLGVDPDKNWQAQYEIIPGKEKVVAELRQAAAQCDTVILATDLDREGEAIAWHLQQVIGGDTSKYKRIIFNEITASAIHEALKHPTTLNQDQVNAQQTRRFLDRVVGFMVSPLLWTRIARGLSAGRVQSVALRILCQREQAIKQFIPQEYWTIDAHLLHKKTPIIFAVTHYQGKKFSPVSQAQIAEHLTRLKQTTYTVSDVIEKQTQTRPNPPFITSTLQQSASTKLGFGIKKTMTLAQKLYESGAITYMRTDSTNISKEAIGAVRGFIDSTYGDKYLPDSPNLFAKKSTAQEAHEAIRPTVIACKRVEGEKELNALYGLIRDQFIACQMTPARYFTKQIIINTEQGYQLRAKGRTCIFDGFTRVMPVKDEEQQVPNVTIADDLALKKFVDTQHFTKAPARFTEATLVKELEKKSIGRPSTYVPIISTLQQREYVALENKKFHVKRVGEIVDAWLQRFFADLVRFDFTADMEHNLDKISKGQIDWRALLDEYYRQLTTTIDSVGNASETAVTPMQTDVPCPDCGNSMLLRYSGNDFFLGCSQYSNKQSQCKKTLSLEEQSGAIEEIEIGKRCPLCESRLQSFIVADGKHQVDACSNYPHCYYTNTQEGNFAPVATTISCHKCAGEMILKSGRFGKYYACNQCTATRKALPDGTPAPVRMDPIPMPELRCNKVDDYYLLREGAAGLFLAASQYPKHREARSPLIKELVLHKHELEPRLQYLCDAPLFDDKGNDTIVCFAKKTSDYYISSVSGDKRTKFKLVFDPINKQWQM